jgi:hypothetical protein
MNIEEIFSNLPHYEELASMWYGRATFVLTAIFAGADQILKRLDAASKETPTTIDDEVVHGVQRWLDVCVRTFKAFSQYKG